MRQVKPKNYYINIYSFNDTNIQYKCNTKFCISIYNNELTYLLTYKYKLKYKEQVNIFIYYYYYCIYLFFVFCSYCDVWVHT